MGFITSISFLLISYIQVIYSIILGIVQGVSEWLPISSKTQVLIFVTYIFKLNFNAAYAFGLFMEIGTLVAAVIYFRREVISLLKVIIGRGDSQGVLLFKYVLVSTIFTGIVGAPLYLYVVDAVQGHYNLGIPMMIIGIVLIGDAVIISHARSRYKKATNKKDLKSMTFKEYILVGVAQGIAALPGVSRSGITTSTFLLLNFDAGEAFRLSFIDMILATGAVVPLTWIASKAKVMSGIAIIGIPGLLIAIGVATVISLLLIGFLLNIAKKSSIIYLVLALGVIAMAGGAIAAIYNVGTAIS